MSQAEPRPEDCRYTQNLICPFCGDENHNSWEVHGDDGEINCGNCGKTMCYERQVDVTYSTWKLPPPAPSP